MFLTVKSQPGTPKIFRFSKSSSNTPRALQYDDTVLRAKRILSNNCVETFPHIKSFKFEEKCSEQKKHYDRIVNSDVRNIHQTLQRN